MGYKNKLHEIPKSFVIAMHATAIKYIVLNKD